MKFLVGGLIDWPQRVAQHLQWLALLPGKFHRPLAQLEATPGIDEIRQD